MNKYNLEEIEKRKNNALMFRNPVEYFKACNELGIEPEIKDLYELGQVEIGFKLSNLEKSVKRNPNREKRIPGRDFYIPKYKHELKVWMREYCEKHNKPLPKKFHSMRKKQLYAIYFSIMKQSS